MERSMKMAGVLLCGHGSRDGAAQGTFAALAAAMASPLARLGLPLAWGFLERACPTLADGLEQLHTQGVRQVLVVPALLFAAGHILRDIPAALADWQAAHPETTIRCAPELGVDPRMVAAVAARIAESPAAPRTAAERRATHLLLVGRGTSGAAANAGVQRIARLLQDGGGFGGVATAWAGTLPPSVPESLAQLVAGGAARIVVAPYLLSGGVLLQRIHAAAAQAITPNGRITVAAPLAAHPGVVATLLARVTALAAGHAGPPAPGTLAVGVGCENGTRADEVLALIRETLAAGTFTGIPVAALATLERKARDPALLAAAAALALPLRTFSAARLEAETPRLATPSAAVFQAVGCHGVAEAAALAASGPDAILGMAKRRSAHATCAVAWAPEGTPEGAPGTAAQ